ncbi:MAG: diheme cytochrome c precursor [Planctomycetota bacterium]
MSDTPGVVGRVVTLSLSAVVGVAFVGYFVGLRQPVPENHGTVVITTPTSGAMPAPSYAEIRERPLGPNGAFRSDLSTLASRGPSVAVGSPIVITAQQKSSALAERSRLRAYDGAPPTIPHAVDARSAADCLICHEHGLVAGDRVARPMPHEPYASCTQCHVPELRRFGEPELSTDNTFVGFDAPVAGARAWTGAPPVIPHTTNMRSNCLACHGPLGRHGIRTTHPWRHSCQQCHAPSAALNQQPQATGRAFLGMSARAQDHQREQ